MTSSLIYVVILIFSVVLHELAHGFVAYRLGDPTAKLEGRLTLNPIPHMDWFGSLVLPLVLVLSGSPFVIGWAKPVPFNPYRLSNQRWGGALVAIAGPLTNLLIAGIAAIVLHLGGFALAASFVGSLLTVIIITNIALAIFNLIPVPPLDGHHILFALIPERYDYLKNELRRYSLPLVLLVVFFGWRFIEPIIIGLYKLLVSSY